MDYFKQILTTMKYSTFSMWPYGPRWRPNAPPGEKWIWQPWSRSSPFTPLPLSLGAVLWVCRTRSLRWATRPSRSVTLSPWGALGVCTSKGSTCPLTWWWGCSTRRTPSLAWERVSRPWTQALAQTYHHTVHSNKLMSCTNMADAERCPVTGI